MKTKGTLRGISHASGRATLLLDRLEDFRDRLKDIRQKHLAATQQCNLVSCLLGVLTKEMEAAIAQAEERETAAWSGNPKLQLVAGREAEPSRI